MSGVGRRVLQGLVVLAAAAVLGALVVLPALALRTWAVEVFKIPAGSMAPTLGVGDTIIVRKWQRQVERGAVMTFTHPADPEMIYVKRVVAVGGDQVELCQGVLRINGEPVARRSLGRSEFPGEAPAERVAVQLYEETLGDHSYVVAFDEDVAERPDYGPVAVPSGHAFLLGDRRDQSYDSRFWGFVPDGNFTGTAWRFLSSETHAVWELVE